VSELGSPALNSSCTQEVTKHRRSGGSKWPKSGWNYLETTLLGSFAQACQLTEDKLKAFADRTEVRLDEARTK
jgi:hypothetical protein